MSPRNKKTHGLIVLNYITDGAFLKLEHKIKQLLETDHVIHDAIKKKAKILVKKQQFYDNRKKLRAHLTKWNEELDPDDIRECNTQPKVSHIAQDLLSEEADSFLSNSINSIMAFEVSEIYVPTEKSTKMSGLTSDTHQCNNQQTEQRSNSSEEEIITLRRQVEDNKQELNKQTQKIEQIQEMLQMVLSKLNEQEQAIQTYQKNEKHRRQLYSQS
jgi:hypothetical protein